MSHSIKAQHKRMVKSVGRPEEAPSLKAFAREVAKAKTYTHADGALTVIPGSATAIKWLAAKAAHRPAKLHRAAVKAAKAEGRRAFARKSSSARRAAKAKAAK